MMCVLDGMGMGWRVSGDFSISTLAIALGDLCWCGVEKWADGRHVKVDGVALSEYVGFFIGAVIVSTL
jgi:hypothetical protein